MKSYLSFCKYNKNNSYTIQLFLLIFSIIFLSSPVKAHEIYEKFPITVKNYKGNKKDSVSYSGQIARQVLHDSLKKLASKGHGSKNPKLKRMMLDYFKGTNSNRKIISPASKGVFKVKQKLISEISTNKTLSNKTLKRKISGMPNEMSGAELVEFWIDKASSAKKGYDAKNGYDYPQLISKFIMGATFYNQAVDNYLDEKLRANQKPNNKPYKKGSHYTGKEHSWDEAFGYFGTPIHTLELTPRQIYEIAKQGSKSKNPRYTFNYADYNNDGVIDLKTEMVFGPAYYAASFDAKAYDKKSNKTQYLHNITRAFINGRNLISSANGEKLNHSQRRKLKKYSRIIAKNWELVLAEATFKYAGSVYKDLVKLKKLKSSNKNTNKTLRNYVKHWGELKGFSLALQSGKKVNSNVSEKLNNLIGYSPVMPDGKQVATITNNGQYVRLRSNGVGEYMLHMLKVQDTLAKNFAIRAKNNDATADIEDLILQIGPSDSAEND